jgi:signal transduction histidine kinase
VDNVLDFASIERGVKRYLLRQGDLAEVLRKSVESVAGAVAAADMKLDVHLPDGLPVVWMDRDAIGQVATNLLSNAMKYGSDGLWIGLTAQLDGENITFSVSDRGMGIGPRDVEKIFEHYYRVDTPDVRKRRGTGIGLTIVRYIVEAHRGTISVHSVLGEGTTFTVSLPLDAPPEDGGT